jgi:hypothetical protein
MEFTSSLLLVANGFLCLMSLKVMISFYKWFDYLKAKRHYIIGYVIMPNHIHALIAFKNSPTNINTIIGNGKRFMAYEMVKRLQEMKETELLQELTDGVTFIVAS